MALYDVSLGKEQFMLNVCTHAHTLKKTECCLEGCISLSEANRELNLRERNRLSLVITWLISGLDSEYISFELSVGKKELLEVALSLNSVNVKNNLIEAIIEYIQS